MVEVDIENSINMYNRIRDLGRNIGDEGSMRSGLGAIIMCKCLIHMNLCHPFKMNLSSLFTPRMIDLYTFQVCSLQRMIDLYIFFNEQVITEVRGIKMVSTFNIQHSVGMGMRVGTMEG